MAKKVETISCYCLIKDGNMHCPPVTDRRVLERTFNYQVRGEAIVPVEIDKSFKCEEERKRMCKKCPFN